MILLFYFIIDFISVLFQFNDLF